MAYYLLRPEARAMYGAIKPLRIGIRRSGRLDLASRSAAPAALSIASSPPRNGTPSHLRPRRSSCGQKLGRRDEHISWTTSCRLFSETSPRFRQLCVPNHSSISIPRAAACGVLKSFGAGTGQPLTHWRSLSRSRAADAQRPTNEAITAKSVMLVLEKADGSTETTVVSRKQALDAARIANLDLVQVNDKIEPVVCRLMNAKVEEYRRRRLLQVKSQRKQHKKEIRMKGMIASHDFERKANDIKRHLERGDVVKVVLDAPTSVLSRSLHCLDDLQAKIEEFIDPSTVVMKFSHGANALSRREISCTPKTKGSAKPNAKPKPTKAESVVRPSSARLEKGLDEKVLSQLRTEAGETDSSDSDSDGVPNDEDSKTPVGLAEEEMGELGTGGSLSGGMGEDDGVGQENSVEGGPEELDLEEALLWEMEDCVDFEAEGGESAGAWGRQRSRRDTAASQGQSRSNKAKDTSGGGGRKTGGRKSAGVVDDVVFGVDDDEGFTGVGTSGGGARRERTRPGTGKQKGGARRGSEGNLERNASPSADGARSGSTRRENTVDSKQRVGRQGGVFGRGGGSVDGDRRERTSRAARIPPPVHEGREGRGGINGLDNVPDRTIQPPQYRWGRINNREGVNAAAEDGTGASNNGRENETAGARPRSRLPPKVSTASSKEGASDGSGSD